MYECRVWTSDVRFAGTDSNVSMTVYGDKGKTESLALSNNTDNFERNKLDTFKLEFPSVGKIFKIRIGHDNKGLMQQAWHLHKVELQNLKTNVIYTFIGDRWISKSKGDKNLLCELPVSSKEKLVNGERKPMKQDEGVEVVNYEVSKSPTDVSHGG